MNIRYKTEGAILGIVRSVVSLIPAGVALFLGTTFGRVAYYMDARHRKVAFANFAVAFPQASRQQARKTIRDCYAFFGSYLFAILRYWKGFHAGEMHFEFEGLENLQAAYERNRGVICFTGHYGVWELMAIAHGLQGFSLGVVARKLDNPYLDGMLTAFRTSSGNFVIDKRAGFRPMLKALREGRGLALLIDQNVTTDDRIFVEFFGKQASTTPALALLKLKTDCSLIPAFAQPLSRNRYRFIYGPPVEVPRSGNRQEDVGRITQACTAIIEDQIRLAPRYWLWLHRRWKTQPGLLDPLPGAQAVEQSQSVVETEAQA
ncbi:MAG TPA: lysophospholipid acyltransferase family protein [Acidobacteriota bacterium]|nr:lysophospholipid acyltransferase family protein [Acidobacteriota bacterium]